MRGMHHKLGKLTLLTLIQTTVKLLRICLGNYLLDDEIVQQRCFSIEGGGRNEGRAAEREIGQATKMRRREKRKRPSGRLPYCT